MSEQQTFEHHKALKGFDRRVEVCERIERAHHKQQKHCRTLLLTSVREPKIFVSMAPRCGTRRKGSQRENAAVLGPHGTATSLVGAVACGFRSPHQPPYWAPLDEPKLQLLTVQTMILPSEPFATTTLQRSAFSRENVRPKSNSPFTTYLSRGEGAQRTVRQC